LPLAAKKKNPLLPQLLLQLQHPLLKPRPLQLPTLLSLLTPLLLLLMLSPLTLLPQPLHQLHQLNNSMQS